MKIIEKIRRAVGRMFGVTSVQSLGIVPCISQDMREELAKWQKLYIGEAYYLKKGARSLNLPATISSEVARLVTLELKSRISGSARAEYIDSIYQAQVIKVIRPQVERACALGGIAIKPYLTYDGIGIDFCDPTAFIPTEYDCRGVIVGAVFLSTKADGGKFYTKLEKHHFENGKETIENRAYCSDVQGELGREIKLTEVAEWADLAPTAAVVNINQPLFAYFKMPQANEIDSCSPLGVSVFSRAIDLIQDADEQYSRILWEYESGERAVYVSDLAIKRSDEEGSPIVPRLADRVIRSLEVGDDNFFKEYSPTMRSDDFISGLNTILRRVEFAASLAYGTLSDPSSVDKTAEEIRASKQRSYAAVVDIQNALKAALEQVIYAIGVWCDIGKLAPDGDYEVSFDFDDSLVSDRAKEFEERKKLVDMGVMQAWELRSWYLGEDEKTARAMCEVSNDEILEE